MSRVDIALGVQGPCVLCGNRFRGPRQGEGHVGVRFGDHAHGRGNWCIELDGANVANDCLEALAGPDGWVIVYVGAAKTLCPNGRWHGYAIQKHGVVQISHSVAVPA